MNLVIAVFFSWLCWAFAQLAMLPAYLSGRPAWVWLGLPFLVGTASFFWSLFAFADAGPEWSIADPKLRRRLRRQFRRSARRRWQMRTAGTTEQKG